MLVSLYDTSPVTCDVIALMVVTVEDYGVCAIAIIDKLRSTALNHRVVFVAPCRAPTLLVDPATYSLGILVCKARHHNELARCV